MKTSIASVCLPVARKVTIGLLSLSATLAFGQSTKSIFPLLPPSVSTIPSNGDVNPYGVAFGPKAMPTDGILQPGDILVSNFNGSQNLQGTGTTIVRVDKSGKTSTFFTSSNGQSGLTAALGILTNGCVLIGNLSTLDGSAATIRSGKLSVVDRNGTLLGTIGTLATVDGPWGMAVYDVGNGTSRRAHVFLSNVLSGVISRFEITYNATSISASDTVVATGFSHRVDPAALVLGPAGLAYDASQDILYVASSADNAIYELPGATEDHSGPVTPRLFVQDLTHLHGPLDLSILPNGHLLVANSDGSNADPNQPSELAEYNAKGEFIAQMPIDPNNGAAFGLATRNMGWGTFRLAAVNDNTNALNIWTIVAQ